MCRLMFIGVASLALCVSLSSTSHAGMDQGCIQRLLGQQNERLQLCRDKFQGEHRDLCEAAAQQEHLRKVKICAFREKVPAPGSQ